MSNKHPEYDDLPSGTTFYPDGRVVLPEGEGVLVNPSYSDLRQALQDIRQLTQRTGDVPHVEDIMTLAQIYDKATKALERKPVTQVSK